jgi:hypothetical protein
MPTRILRDWTDSEAVSSLSAHAERHFCRLIMKVDDYGRLTANPKVLRPLLYPLLVDEVTEADLQLWNDLCVQAGLVVLYEADDRRKYLAIRKFGQRTRAPSKFPPPPDEKGYPPTVDGEPPSDDGHLSGKSKADGLYEESNSGSTKDLRDKLTKSSSDPPTNDGDPLTTAVICSPRRTRISDAQTETDANAGAASTPASVRSGERRPGGTDSEVDPDELDNEIKAYIRDHRMLHPWGLKAHAKCRKLVIDVGWPRAKALIDEGIAAGASGPIGWALGKVENTEQAQAASSKKSPVSLPTLTKTQKREN